MHSRCSGTNREGGPCNAEIRPGRKWCRWHDPELEAERAEWRRKGGEARSNRNRARKQLPDAVLTPVELQGLLSKALRDVLMGQLEPGIANAAAGLSRALVTIRESAELEERLSALEAAAGLLERRRA